MPPNPGNPLVPRLVPAVLATLALLALVAYTVSRWLLVPVPQPVAEPHDELAQTLDRVLRRRPDTLPGMAIRPLAGSGATPEVVALAASVCAALAERLARLPALRVVPCTSTAAAVAADLADERLARLLAVGFVLKGSLEPLPGERMRVRLVLHEAATARPAWQLDDEIGRGELQSLPRRVAEATGRTLGQPDPSRADELIAPPLYAKHLQAVDLARRVSIDDRRRAIALLDEVLAEAAGHVPSLYLRHSVRGTLLGNLGEPGRRETVAELNAAREAHVRTGLEMARRLTTADALDLRGQYLMLGHEFEIKQWGVAFERLNGMLQRHPRHPGLMRLAARVHLHAGWIGRARELALAAAQINALDAEAVEILARIAGIQGDDAQMRELIALARRIGHEGLGPPELIETFRRADWAALEAAYTRYVAWGGRWSGDWVAGYARGLADPAAREAAVRTLDAHDAATRQHFAGYIVEYALLGDPERSLRSVQRHSRMAPASWMQGLWWPELAAVRQLPGFSQAMKDLGAADAWERHGPPDLCSRDPGGDWRCR